MSTFWFYGDESGIHDGANWCVVCGYVGREDHWVTFHTVWKQLLDEFGVTDFHSKEFFGRTSDGKRVGQYAGWTDAQAASFLEHLTAQINLSELIHPVGCGVNVSDFHSLSVGERRYLTGGHFVHGRFRHNTGAPTQPYYLALIDVLVDVLRGTPGDGSAMHLMMDRQNVLSAQAVNAINVAHNKTKIEHPEIASRLGSVAFDDRIKFGGLQAADLLTHLWYCYAESLVTGKRVRGERADALKVLTERKPQLVIQNRETMNGDLAKHLPADVLAKIRALTS